MTSLTNEGSPARFRQAWRSLLRRLALAWRAWCRVWQLCEAICSIALGAILAPLGAFGIAVFLIAVTRGQMDDAGLGVVFSAFFGVGGGVMIAEGVRELKAWWRAR